jgi:outer membrane protein assembly factor BamB
VIAASEGGTVQLLDRDGLPVWRKSVGKVTTDPALAGDRVVVVSGDGDLVALDTATGERAIRVRLPEEPRWNGPVTIGDLVYLAGDSGKLACVDLAEQRVVWSDAIGEGVRARPAVMGSKLLVVTSKGGVLMLDRKDGTVLGRSLLGGSARHPALALADGFVAATERGQVVRFDAEGNVAWRFDAKEDIGSPPSLVADRIVFVTRRGSLVSLRP